MRTYAPLILSAALLALVGCQREAASPEVGAAPPPGQQAAPADIPPATAPVTAPATSASAADAVLTLLTAGVPQPFVADASSRTLYFVEGDMDGAKCTGACLETWPPVLVDTGAPGLSGALTGTVATIERADGGRQVTYNGHPLYRYAGDVGVGRMAGNGVKDQWGQWHGLAADGSPLPANAPSAEAPAADEKPAVPAQQ